MFRIDDRNRALLMIAGVVLIVILALIDDVTGHQFRLSFVYIIPIVLASIFLSRRVGILMSVLSAIVWFIIDIRSEWAYSSSGFHLWNAVVRLTFFILVTHGIYLLMKARKRDEELTAFVVHDLKTPLANMVTGLHCIKDRNQSDAKIDEFAQMGLTSGKRMEMMIHSLIDLSKMEGGEKIAKPEPMDVEKVARESLEIVSLWAQKSGAQQRLLNESERETINADSEIITRILSNLLSNAIKVSPSNGVVTLRIWDRGEREIAYSVQDEGPGIPAQWRDKIFDPHYISESSKDGVYRGSGLGLTFCRLAVHDMGGDIWVDSQEGEGTTVTFTLPI